MLQRKRKAAYDVSCRLNQLKQKIDEVHKHIHTIASLLYIMHLQLRRKLVDKKKGQMTTATTSDGRQILDNEEYNYLKELQEVNNPMRLLTDIYYCN